MFVPQTRRSSSSRSRLLDVTRRIGEDVFFFFSAWNLTVTMKKQKQKKSLQASKFVSWFESTQDELLL